MTIDLTQFANDDYCYLTTTGHVSSKPHTIEIWFAKVSCVEWKNTPYLHNCS